MTIEILDLFCGAGGWAAALGMLGVEKNNTLGIDWFEDSAATHAAAGFPTIVADVAALDPLDVVNHAITGLIASPPCQTFSQAGLRAGVAHIELLLEHIAKCRGGWVDFSGKIDAKSSLILEPLRWAWALKPVWITCEQVTVTLPIWQAMNEVLEAWGYSTWSGILSAEEYGVPQVRKRAILVARCDGEQAIKPEPTHTKFRREYDDYGQWLGSATTIFGAGLKPWISMSDVLCDGAPVESNRPAPTVTSTGEARHGTSVFASKEARAAATKAVTPGYFDGGKLICPTPAQAAILQSFPDDWPFQSDDGSKYVQIGNAIPPLLARAVLKPLIEGT